jgi:uracil-DNA glycosylase
LPEESRACRPFLLEEVRLLRDVIVIIGLGKIAFDASFDACRELEMTGLTSRPRFGHGTEIRLKPDLVLLGSFHPSQQNTFTGKLTEQMFDAVFSRARLLLRHR